MFELESSSTSLSRQAYERMRDQIISLERPPGELLEEAELMSFLGLGRTPIREAIQRLACEGLVVIRPRRGTYVAGLEPNDLQRIFELRQELEGYAAALAAERANELDLAGLDRVLASLDEIEALGESVKYLEIDCAFHRAVARGAHNRYVENYLGRIYNLHRRFWHLYLGRLGPIRDSVEQHRPLLEAIRCHDSHMAEAAMRKHIRDFQSRVKGAM